MSHYYCTNDRPDQHMITLSGCLLHISYPREVEVNHIFRILYKENYNYTLSSCMDNKLVTRRQKKGAKSMDKVRVKAVYG